MISTTQLHDLIKERHLNKMARKIIGRIITHTCMIFTATAVFISAFSAALQISSLALSFSALLRILLLSALISLADLIFLADRLGLAAKIFIHYAAFIISFLAIFMAGNAGHVNGVIYVAVALSILYFIVAGICAAIYASRLRKKRDESKYSKQFGGV